MLRRLLPLILLFPSSTALAQTEPQRVRDHLIGAEREARSHNIDHLTPDQRARREQMLQVLAEYRDRNVFPLNLDFDQPRPYFVDAAGTRCAMAELIWQSGSEALVREVASSRNNAYVAELIDDPRLVAWLDRHGLTAEEAARIQPAYCAQLSEAICRPAPVRSIFEAFWTGEGSVYTVEVIHLDDGSLKIGDQVQLAPAGQEHGARALAAFGEGEETYHIDLASNRIMNPQQVDCAIKPTISIEELVAALQSEDCADRLEIADPLWAATRCISSPTCPEAEPELPLDPIDVPETVDQTTRINTPDTTTSCRAQAPQDLLLLLLLPAAAWLFKRRA